MAIVDARDKQIRRQTVEHSDAGLRGLVNLFAKHGVGEVAASTTGRPSPAVSPVVVISPKN